MKQIILFALIACATSAYAQTQTQPSQTSSDAKKPVTAEIVVTATRGERHVEDLPVSVSIIHGDAITHAPALTSDDLLRTIPSLSIPLIKAEAQHPTANSVSMRGLGGQRALIMVDGVPLNDAFFGYIHFEKVPTEAIDRVEVVRGGSSSLFGSYALGGAVNMLTKPPAGTMVHVDTGYGSLNTSKLNVYAGTKISDALSIGGSINGFKTDGYVKIAPEVRGPADIASSSSSINGALRADYTPVSTLHFFGRTNYFANEQKLETRLSSNDRHIFDLMAGGSWSASPKTTMNGTLFYGADHFSTTNTDFVEPSSRSGEYISNVHSTPTTDLGGSLQWNRAFGGKIRYITLGGDARQIRGEDRANLFDPAGVQTGTEIGGGRQRFVGLFGEVSLAPMDRLEVLASGRLDSWTNHGFERTTATGEQVFPDRSESQFDPRLSVRYELAQGTALRGAIYRAFRAPTLDNLYRRFTSSGFALLPNANLGPETLVGGELGYDFFRGNFHGQANLFRSDVSNLIGTRITSFFPVFTVESINVGKTRSEGVELIAEYDVTRSLNVNFGYTHANAVIVSNPEDPSQEGQPAGGVPKNRVNFDVTWHLGGGSVVGLRARYLSEQIDEFSGGFLDAHTVIDASVSRPIVAGLELFALGENLFNAKYIANNFGGPQLGAPRQWFGGIRWTAH